MLKIGEFAEISGLTVKALRFYDETGLLTPAEVDPHSSYRLYAPSQLRRAATIGVLRAMELPLAQVSEVLENPDLRQVIVDRFVSARQAERSRQDEMITEGGRVLDGYDTPLELQTRQAAEQPWVGVIQTVTPQTLDQLDYEAVMNPMMEAMERAGLQPVGPSWSTFAEQGGDLSMTLALACSRPAPAGWEITGVTVRTGVLPERTERFVRLDPGLAMGTPLGMPHPGALALWEADEDLTADSVRQVFLVCSPEEVAIELVIDEPGAEA